MQETAIRFEEALEKRGKTLAETEVARSHRLAPRGEGRRLIGPPRRRGLLVNSALLSSMTLSHPAPGLVLIRFDTAAENAPQTSPQVPHDRRRAQGSEDGRIPRGHDPGRRRGAAPRRAPGADPGRGGAGQRHRRRAVRGPRRRDRRRRRDDLEGSRPDRQGQGAAAGRMAADARRSRSSSPTSTSPPTNG